MLVVRKIKNRGMDKSGFTLVELLVVIAIIALLLSILMPSLQKAKMLAQQVVCSSRDRQLGLALAAYTNDYDGWIMPFNTVYPKGAADQSKVWQSPRDLDPTIKIADHTWYGILWSTKALDSRDVFFCPSVQPSSNNQYKAKTGSNVEETGSAWILGMRTWAVKDSLGGPWVNWTSPKRVALIKKPSDFFLIADSANPGGLPGIDYKGARYGQIYCIVDFERITYSWTSWKPSLHLAHSDKAGAVFADGHSEFKPMQYWCDMQNAQNWQTEYNLSSTGGKSGFVVFDAPVKNQWLLKSGKYILQPLAPNWAPMNGR